ncbi:hypothetical protein HUT16_05545 [Kitasatospora sp. NA04385]|uniref:hypothetical protein n=1 Tax=Kitasatospora sp. NA04385 TaxID=2742135 RepID=UPI001590318B|nr:hypothetical protein [Kitasatospora sp. NA04385]QKW18596.1 hypothetical protein HUT16_05545 [Kitasatospora sp. NA04385]
MSEDPEFTVLVTSVGERRIEVYQVARAAVRWSLWESSRRFAQPPVNLPGEVPFREAARTVAALRAAGATAGLRCGWCARAVDPEVPVDPGPCREQRSFYGRPCPASG